jgi:hypothetical protein
VSNDTVIESTALWPAESMTVSIIVGGGRMAERSQRG